MVCEPLQCRQRQTVGLSGGAGTNGDLDISNQRAGWVVK
jgi:hypothetical protein